MRKVITQLSVALFAIAIIVYGRPVNIPDAVHTLHGLPLNWGTHELSTIAGPVDMWRVNIVNLSIDLAIWFGIVAVTPLIMDKIGME